MMKTWTIESDSELNLTAVSSDELQAVTGGSIDLEVPQCGNVIPRWNPQTIVYQGSILSLSFVQLG